MKTDEQLEQYIGQHRPVPPAPSAGEYNRIVTAATKAEVASGSGGPSRFMNLLAAASIVFGLALLFQQYGGNREEVAEVPSGSSTFVENSWEAALASDPLSSMNDDLGPWAQVGADF